MFSHNSRTRKFINFCDLVFCLTSGYLYMWLARFGDKIDSHELVTINLTVELYFAFSMYANFMTDFLPEGQNEPCRDLLLIAQRYWKEDFLFHAITLFPLTLFVEINAVWRHLYLIKVTRTFSAMKVFDVSKIYHNIKDFTRN